MDTRCGDIDPYVPLYIMKTQNLSIDQVNEMLNKKSGKYGAAIKNAASNILKDAQDAEEAVSDTYLTVWNRIPPENPQYLGAYACRIARNLSLKCFYANTAQKRNSYYDVALDNAGMVSSSSSNATS